MPERLTTNGRTYQDPPRQNSDPAQNNPYYSANRDRLNPDNPNAYNANPYPRPNTVAPQPTYQIENSEKFSYSEFGQPDSATTLPIQPIPGGSRLQPRQEVPATANGSPRATEDQLKGTAYEGAAIVGSEDGFFSTGSDNQGQVVIAGGVNGRAVSLSLGSVLPPGVLDSNAVFNILADFRVNKIAKETQDDKGNFYLQSQLTEAKEELSKVQDTLAGLLAGTRDKRNTKEEQDNVINKFNSIINDSGHPPIKRYLQEFSYLLFTRDNAKIIMPFFENPRIEEKRGANYSIIPAAGSTTPMIMFNHTEFANIKVSFRLNPLHIAEMMIKEGKGSVDDFIINVPPLISNPLSVNGEANSRYKKKINILNQLIKEYKEKLTSELPDMIKNWQFGGDNENVLYAYRELPSLDQLETNYKRAQALCLCWIYLIRESVFFRVSTNNSQIQGPTNPEAELLSDLRNFFQGNVTGSTQVLLKHGPVFYHIPCALLNYEIKEATETTYDVPTHMANVFDISLTLYATPEAWRAAAGSVGTNTDGIELMSNDATSESQPEISTPPSTEGAEVQLQNQFSEGIR